MLWRRGATGARGGGPRLLVAGAMAVVAASVAGIAIAAPRAGGSGSAVAGPVPGPVSPEDAAVLRQAEHILVARCMRSRGFFYAESSQPTAQEPIFRYVIDDVRWARLHGYGLSDAEDSARSRPDDANRRYRAGLSPERRAAYRTTLFGDRDDLLTVRLPVGGVLATSRTGCLADARRRLYGDAEAWFRANTVAVNLSPLYVPQVVTHPRYQSAVQAWAGCMRAAGHPYADPARLRDALPGLTAGRSRAAARGVEVRVAVAEATCARATPLAGTVAELDQHFQRLARLRYRGEVETQVRLQRAALPLARQLAGPGGTRTR